MTYKQLQELAPEEFKRLTGVRRPTVEKMVEALGEQERRKKKSGRPAKLAGLHGIAPAMNHMVSLLDSSSG